MVFSTVPVLRVAESLVVSRCTFSIRFTVCGPLQILSLLVSYNTGSYIATVNSLFICSVFSFLDGSLRKTCGHPTGCYKRFCESSRYNDHDINPIWYKPFYICSLVVFYFSALHFITPSTASSTPDGTISFESCHTLIIQNMDDRRSWIFRKLQIC